MKSSLAQPPTAFRIPPLFNPKPVYRATAHPAPRMTGARVFGCRPGSPVSIFLRATGEQPLRWSAEGLPEGIALDADTGELSGRLDRPGTFNLAVRVRNVFGGDERTVQLKIGPKIALTPPTGWNSWNCWGKHVDDAKIRAAARGMVETGLIHHGWTYINIDDGWQGERCPTTGALRPNEKFPDMKGLCDYVHGLGLKIGIYSTPWRTSYAGFTGGASGEPAGPEGKFGTRSHHAEDVRQFAEWGFDYLKYDWFPNDVEHTEIISRELRSCGRDIILSLSNSAPIEHAADWSRLAECWRTTGDIHDCWITPPNPQPWEHSVTEIGFAQDDWASCAGPGHWNDADMLVVGRLGWGTELRDSRLTFAEQRSHVSLWCLLASPLLLGCDLTKLDGQTLSLLTNDEVLAVDQDAAGVQGRLVGREDGIDVIGRPLADGGWAIGVFNRGDVAAEVGLPKVLQALPEPKRGGPVRDLWQRRWLSPAEVAGCLVIGRHDVAMLKIER